MKFGEQLRTLRNSQKMTQKELADMLGISPSTIGMSRYKNTYSNCIYF